jgi:hypothetical protein
MNNPGRRTSISHQGHLQQLLTKYFRDPDQALDLIDEFLRHKRYDQTFCLRLIALARQPTNAAWEIRRLAALMLENQILKLEPGQINEYDLLLTRLGLKHELGLGVSITSSVLKEGFSTTDLSRFTIEFRRKLQRLGRIHRQLNGAGTPESAICDFVDLSRRDCKLSLARYLFTADEVVDEILKAVQVTDGIEDLDLSPDPLTKDELRRTLEILPDFEAAILKSLCEASNIYWVSETTSSEINSLIEYPMTTVVLVIKPPGSDIEFEIKRAGRRGRNSLNVVYARNGYTVPPSHRLDGGSMQELLRYEASNACRLGTIFRLVHKAEAPMPDYISRSTIYSVPVSGASVATLDYFTQPELFGDGFREMRIAMKESVDAFVSEDGHSLPDAPGSFALTAQFVGHMAPAQAIVCGTSSFRLDKLATYLSDNGPKEYFKRGRRVACANGDARRLADELLEEVLGAYQPPDVAYESHEQYVNAAFDIAENRQTADQVYLSLVEQIAKFWGTFLAIGGFSRGESFIGRNVGLRTVWVDGRWKVEIIFMDHDAVVIPWPGDGQFYAKGALPNISIDERYIWGRYNERRFASSEMGYLQRIYRIGSDVDAEGQERAKLALKDAYKKTQNELLTNPRLKQFFSEVFIDRLLVWDTLVEGYLRMNGDKAANASVKKELKEMLAAKGYRNGAYESYMKTIKQYSTFLERYSYLFQMDGETVS